MPMPTPTDFRLFVNSTMACPSTPATLETPIGYDAFKTYARYGGYAIVHDIGDSS